MFTWLESIHEGNSFLQYKAVRCGIGRNPHLERVYFTGGTG
jgi:hypothetical protein